MNPNKHASKTSMHRISYLFSALILCLFTASALTEDLSFTGKVVRVLDGDTLEVLDATVTPRRVRMAGIDAPETGQAYGTQSKRRLIELAAGKVVSVKSTKRDKYRRMVGKVIVDDQDVNLAMVRSGMAWWYREFAGEQSAVDQVLYEAAENRAKGARLGLWGDPHAMAPWDWRHRPPPVGGYVAQCPCDSGSVCTGQRGGRFCVRESGTKRYYPQER